MSKEESDDSLDAAKMLILDVKTRWSSTHQMLRELFQCQVNAQADSFVAGRAIEYRQQINSFVAKEAELAPHELSSIEWKSVETVEQWLFLFREATTQMSATSHPTLFMCYAILRGLQDSLADHLSRLPSASTPIELRDGLIDAHAKLSNYHYIINQSPYYLWACREYSVDFVLHLCI